MRVLFLSNYYSPNGRGGYEQWCEEVAAALVERGHSVCVLTSAGDRRGGLAVEREHSGVEVRRLLHLEVQSGLLRSTLRLLGARARRERENLAHLRRVVSTYRPDAAMIWGMWNVPRSVPAHTEHLLGERVMFYLCDYWPSLPSAYIQQWQAPARRTMSGLPKQLLRRPVLARLTKERPVRLRLQRPICVSRAVRDELVRQGVPIEHARVIYGGTRPQEFQSPRTNHVVNPQRPRLRLLYAGRLTATKGVHTAITALAILAARGELGVCLDIVGRGDHDYEIELRTLARSYRLQDRVRFLGGVARAEMPSVMAEYDALVLLSEWEEPFARIVLEAMAAGLVVVGSLTGGTGEVLVENQTGLTFPGGQADTLADQLQRLLRAPELRKRLAAAGRLCVEERFTLEHMVDQIETALGSVSERGGTVG